MNWYFLTIIGLQLVILVITLVAMYSGETNQGSLKQACQPKMPRQMEFNQTRKCPNHPEEAELISYNYGEIQLRVCTVCGSLFVSDLGKDIIKTRMDELNEHLKRARIGRSQNPKIYIEANLGYNTPEKNSHV